MTKMTIELTDEEAEVWAERAKLTGHASAAEALTAWVAQETERIDPAEVKLLLERMAGDPADDIPLEEGFARIAAKHGFTLPSLEQRP